MDEGTIIGIFMLGAAVGALLESLVRLAFRRRVQQEFQNNLLDERKK